MNYEIYSLWDLLYLRLLILLIISTTDALLGYNVFRHNGSLTILLAMLMGNLS